LGVDVSAEALSPGLHGFEGTTKSWIKCARCSAKLQRPYPVEAMQLEGGEPGKLASSRFRIVVLVRCHGEEMRVALERPSWWTEAMALQSMRWMYAFVLGNGRYRAEFRPDKARGKPRGLATEVR